MPLPAATRIRRRVDVRRAWTQTAHPGFGRASGRQVVRVVGRVRESLPGHTAVNGCIEVEKLTHSLFALGKGPAMAGIAEHHDNRLRGWQPDSLPIVATINCPVCLLTGKREVDGHVAVGLIKEVNSDWSEPWTAALTRELQLPMLRTIDCPENAKLTHRT